MTGGRRRHSVSCSESTPLVPFFLRSTTLKKGKNPLVHGQALQCTLKSVSCTPPRLTKSHRSREGGLQARISPSVPSLRLPSSQRPPRGLTGDCIRCRECSYSTFRRRCSSLAIPSGSLRARVARVRPLNLPLLLSTQYNERSTDSLPCLYYSNTAGASLTRTECSKR